MILDADNMHLMIGNQINNVHKEALGNFNNVFSSIKQYAEDIQTQQSKERPVDFNKRPIPENEKKVSKGVPLESDLWFESLKRFGFAEVLYKTLLPINIRALKKRI